jgi:hypothetical protein
MFGQLIAKTASEMVLRSPARGVIRGVNDFELRLKASLSWTELLIRL